MQKTSDTSSVRRGLLPGLLLWLLCSGTAYPQQAEEQQAPSQQTLERKAQRFAAAMAQEDWPRAIELGKGLVEASPDDHVHPYNLACAYARSADRQAALSWLERAAEKGFADPELVAGDEDLASLEGEEGFAAVLGAVRSNYDHARALFREMAAGSQPVILSPGREGPLPVLVVLHGFGDSSPRFASFFEDLARQEGLLLVAPRSVVPVPGRGFAWGTAADARWQVEQALEEAGRRHSIDPRGIYLLGFSQGGRMAYEIALEVPERFAGVIPVGARPSPRALDLARDLGPEAPPFFLMAGADEPAAAATREAAKILAKAGVKSRSRIYPGVGHHFPRAWKGEIRRALTFFNKARTQATVPARRTP